MIMYNINHIFNNISYLKYIHFGDPKNMFKYR